MKHIIPIEEIEKLAKSKNYFRLEYQANIGMISYSNVYTRINIYLSTMTVATCLDHPKKGKTQMFRKKVTLEELEKLFNNPRTHTGKGYRKT